MKIETERERERQREGKIGGDRREEINAKIEREIGTILIRGREGR